MKTFFTIRLTAAMICLTAFTAGASEEKPDTVQSQLIIPPGDRYTTVDENEIVTDVNADNPPEAPKLSDEASVSGRDTLFTIEGRPPSIYSLPASWTLNRPWWHGMWINTAVLSGAFIGTLFVLECLPEDATAWNRAEISGTPFYKRWFRNIFKKGPEWDHDKFIFNWVLHPYAGAAYFMCARTNGFNFWRSMLYSALISTVAWEFGIEACMERPSYQDLFVTPLIGSIIGEGFYRLKRQIVDRDYEILGSKYIGHILAFFLDPMNEVIGWLTPGECRYIGPGCIQSQPLIMPNPAPGFSPSMGISISATF
jgi:ubiquitin-protein ligase